MFARWAFLKKEFGGLSKEKNRIAAVEMLRTLVAPVTTCIRDVVFLAACTGRSATGDAIGTQPFAVTVEDGFMDFFDGAVIATKEVETTTQG